MNAKLHLKTTKVPFVCDIIRVIAFFRWQQKSKRCTFPVWYQDRVVGQLVKLHTDLLLDLQALFQDPVVMNASIKGLSIDAAYKTLQLIKQPSGHYRFVLVDDRPALDQLKLDHKPDFATPATEQAAKKKSTLKRNP